MSNDSVVVDYSSNAKQEQKQTVDGVSKIVDHYEDPVRGLIVSLIKTTPYMDDAAVKNLRQYKYSGGDLGIIYRYFYNPTATWLV